MISSRIILIALSAFGAAAAAVGSQQEQPACVSKCWANSQYVSNCSGDQQCLCDDSEFQNALYQCLYSQCQTAQFGVALHHALELCAADSINYNAHASGLAHQGNDLRKRGYQTLSHSVVHSHTTHRASGTPVPSPSGPMQSVHHTHSSSRAHGTAPSVPKPSKSTKTVTGYQTVTHTPGQSMSVSAHHAYSTSRAKHATVLTMTTHTVTVRPSHKGKSPVTKTVTLANTISDGQVQVSATPEPSPASYVPVPEDIRKQWNAQRYPADVQSS